MSQRARLIASALLLALLLALPALLPIPAAAGGPARQDRPTVEPPRPTVAVPPKTGDDEEGDGDEDVPNATAEPTATEAATAEPSTTEATTAEPTATEATTAEPTASPELPSSMPPTGGSASAAPFLLILLGGTGLIAGASLRVRPGASRPQSDNTPSREG